MERFYGSFFGRPRLQPIRWDLPTWDELARPFEGRVPSVDVIDRDRDKEMVVRAEIPGVKKEDLEVSLSNNSLTIKGSTKHEETTDEEGEYTHRELSRGSFSRHPRLSRFPWCFVTVWCSDFFQAKLYLSHGVTLFPPH